MSNENEFEMEIKPLQTTTTQETTTNPSVNKVEVEEEKPVVVEPPTAKVEETVDSQQPLQEEVKVEEKPVVTESPKAEEVEIVEEVKPTPQQLELKPSDKVKFNVKHIMLATNDINSDPLIKVFPNPKGDEVRGYMNAVAGRDMDVITHKDLTTKEHNQLIFGFDENGNKRITGVERMEAPKTANDLIGSSFVISATDKINISGVFRIPLVNSGFKIQMRKLSGRERARLDLALARAKLELGRLTLGSVMGNNSIFMQNDIINAALSAITHTNLDFVKAGDVNALKKLIKKRDYPTLVYGLLLCSNPAGITMSVACTAKHGENEKPCEHITTGLLNIGKLFKVDGRLLTDYQKTIITRDMDQKVTANDLTRYEDDFVTEANKVSIELNDNKIVLEFKVPSLMDSSNDGIQWAKDINGLVNSFIEDNGGAGDEEDDLKILRSQLELTALTQFISWVKTYSSYDIDGNLTVQTDNSKNINMMLEELHDCPEVGEIIKKLNDFIYAKNPVTIGLSPQNCNGCGKPQGIDDNIIPLDIEKHFFIRSIVQNAIEKHYEAMHSIWTLQ